ncbi:MAG: phosphatidate cytidylyltransferase [Bdellovibrionaceae bacterium]|nr:phosphatidate cytidylyltransferase [Pseudobdellovibrionaceae bacterium]MDW8190979.1 phosphatidate cytidylyltransferase [Pseudobdellovibrionaceae bacterium]
MILKNSNLLARTISALVLIGIVWLLFHLGHGPLKIFVIAVTFLLQFEAKNLFFYHLNKKSQLILFSLAALTTMLGLQFSFHLSSILMMLAIITAVFSSLRHFPEFSSAEIAHFLNQFLVYLVYTVWLPGYCYLIVDKDPSLFWFSFLLFISLGTDTIAFFIGKKWGKTPLLPQISPKKTAEGALGGLVGALIIGIIFYIVSPQYPILILILGSILGSIFSQAGDLFESLLKRQANVKDSSQLIPGHGGVLDRIDGILFAGPVIYWIMLIYESLV